MPNKEIEDFITKNNLKEKIEKIENITILQSFICPISHSLMLDPVALCNGQSYDRNNITQWLATKNTCPLTGKKLDHKNLIENHNLRKAIIEFLELQFNLNKKYKQEIMRDCPATPPVKTSSAAALKTTNVAPLILTPPSLIDTIQRQERIQKFNTLVLSGNINEIYFAHTANDEEVLAFFSILAANLSISAKIKSIFVSSNFLTSISIPSFLTNLESVCIKATNLRYFAVQPLEYLSYISIEHCMALQSFDLNMLDHLPRLEKLICCHGTLTPEWKKEHLEPKLDALHRERVTAKRIETHRYHGA